ncbi:hypothetical protein KC909_06810, partial [Candidatus Dojkabacteria bacterium]|nr:hypothetical protein [Candidatus Dojkabacteria bacterium]
SDEYILELADVIENTSLAENGLLPHISTYLLLQNDDSLLAKASFNNFDRMDYTDLNATPREAGASDWFQYLKNKVLNNTDHIQEYTSSVNISGNVNQYFSPVANPDNDDTYTIYMRNGGIIQNLTCNLKTIFIVEGDVVINPELLIDQAKDGCVFIVDGQTTINPGGNKGSNDATPITNYDVIEAFIITNRFESAPDTNEDGLLIEGGLIVTGSNDPVFGRDLGNVRNYQAPSEVFRYDGTRYMYLFGEMFTYKKNYNIREKAFINSLN